MRLTLTTFILLEILTMANAQYSPMLTTGSEWHHYAWFEGSCNGILRVSEDSLLNGVSYKKVEPVGDPCTHVLHLMREDTMTRQVFLWRGDNTEIVIYDFSLEVGDTLFFDPSFSSSALVLDSITYSIPDNTSCGDNEYPITTLENPKVFHLRFSTSIDGKVLWVESIGNLADPVWSIFEWRPGDLSDQVLCHYNAEGIKDYQDLSSFCDDPSDCLGLILNTQDIVSSSELKVFPNPATDEVRIEALNSEVGELYQISFFDAQGQFLKRQTINHEGTVRIDELKPGLIFGVVETKSGVLLSLKFVKH